MRLSSSPALSALRHQSVARGLIGSVAVMTLAILLTGCSSTPSGGGTVRRPQQGYAWWPPFPDEPRIQFLTSFEHSEDILRKDESAFESALFGGEARPVITIKKPYGVDMWNGSIYVCDIRGQQVVVFDIKDREVRLMGTTGLQTLSQASDIAIAPDGMKYVSDGIRGVIFVFDPNDRYITMFGYPGFKPTGVAIHGDRLYACDFASHGVVILNRRNGEKIGGFGESGSEDGQFVRPIGIDVDSQGNVYVTDVIACTLQKFGPDGEFLAKYGSLSNEFGKFFRPKHVTVDSEGQFFVVDSSFQNVQIFNADGQVLTFFGSGGSHPGSMFLPVGIEVVEDRADIDLFREYIHPDFIVDRLLLVTNQMGQRRVAVYGFGHLRDGVVAADIQRESARINMGLSTGNEPDVIGDTRIPGVNDNNDQESNDSGGDSNQSGQNSQPPD